VFAFGPLLSLTAEAQVYGTGQVTVGAHLAVSADGVGVGIDADAMVGLFAGDYTGWALVSGPAVAADVVIGRGPSASLGVRTATGVAISQYGAFLPVVMPAAGVGWRWSPGLSGLRLEGRVRGLVVDVGTYTTLEPRTGRPSHWTVTPGLAAPAVLPGELFPPGAVEGRPLRTGGQRVCARGGVLRSTGTALHWLRRAEDEAEAMRAFQRLADELRSAGAPTALVARSTLAAREERGHAVGCLAQAARHGGGAWLQLPPRMAARPAGSHTDALARLAWEAHWDGYDNEGRAADRAAGRATRARDHRGRAVEALIAREEHGHAVFGQEIVAWAGAAGGAGVTRCIDGPPPV
jgi:hypothetical protein